jgi:hypothetical protein
MYNLFFAAYSDEFMFNSVSFQSSDFSVLKNWKQLEKANS